MVVKDGQRMSGVLVGEVGVQECIYPRNKSIWSTVNVLNTFSVCCRQILSSVSSTILKGV